MEEYESDAKGIRLSYLAVAAIVVCFTASLLAVGLGVYYGEMRSHTATTATTGSGPQPATATPTPVPTTQAPENPDDWRLPRTIVPLEYDLQIRPYLPSESVSYGDRNFTFDGEVKILMQCKQQTDTIVMNIKNLNITSVNLTNADGSFIALKSPAYSIEPKLERITFHLSQSLTVGQNYVLSISYNGVLGDSLGGFYRSKYQVNGTTRWLAVTHFECCDARAALPCFDSPEFKARFNVTIIHRTDTVALSNEIVQNSSIENAQWNRTVFRQTPPMSSYLLAFTVNDFKERTSFTNSTPKVMFRVWAPQDSQNQTIFARDSGPTVLDFYAGYFNQSFPLQKQDMLAVPDFAAGAMENWGLVTYRETALLYDAATAWQVNKGRVAVVIAHELAHQWFGDLVTMDWWGDIWLNEGFATYFQYVGAGVILNETERMMRLFPITQLHAAMEVDQLTTSHAIYVSDVLTPSQIESLFDTITYNKAFQAAMSTVPFNLSILDFQGASLLRMLNQLLKKPDGTDVFRLALQHYISLYKYSNTNHSNLWAAIDEVVREQNWPQGPDGQLLNVQQMMNPWITRNGFPLVTVHLHGNTATLKQERFLMDENLTAATNYTWTFPLWYDQLEPGTAPKQVWMNSENPITIDITANASIIFNYMQYSICRINYDADSWTQIKNTLLNNYRYIDEINRAQLLDDSQSLARKGIIDYSLALDLTQYLLYEDSYLPWKALQPSLLFIENMMRDKPEFEYYKNYVVHLLKNSFENIDNRNDEFFKNIIYDMACSLEYAPCVNNATKLFSQYMKDCSNDGIQSSVCSKIPQYYRKTVYCIGVASGGYKEFEFMWNLYQTEQQAVENVNLLYGLCCTQKIYLVSKLLQQSLQENPVIRSQDVKILFGNLGGNPVAQLMMWNFLASNIDKILKRYGENFFNLAAVIRAATSTFNTDYQVQELRNFLQQHPKLQTGTTTLNQQLENARINVLWMQKYFDVIVQWLKQHQL